MSKKQIYILIYILLGLIILTNLPFLPGPSFLNKPAQIFYNSGQVIGILGIILFPIGFIWMIIEFRKHKREIKKLFISSLIWLIPLCFFISTNFLSPIFRNFSRNIAINNAADLIENIEKYNGENSEYPSSLDSVNFDQPNSWIIGIPEYYYVKNDDNFNISFTQNVNLSFNFEVVVYDKNDMHVAKGELKDLYDTGKTHWQYYIYD